MQQMMLNRSHVLRLVLLLLYLKDSVSDYYFYSVNWRKSFSFRQKLKAAHASVSVLELMVCHNCTSWMIDQDLGS